MGAFAKISQNGSEEKGPEVRAEEGIESVRGKGGRRRLGLEEGAEEKGAKRPSPAKGEGALC